MDTRIVRIVTGAILLLVPMYMLSAAEISLDQYHDFRSMERSLETLADGYPDLMSLKSLGETIQGRDISVVTLTAGSNPEEQPGILIVGGVQGKDVAASEACLGILQGLASAYGQVDSVTAALETTTFYIFPRVNPDASEAYFSSPKYERVLNARPMDLDTDGRVDEDGYNDLNGDGFITLLRIPDPAGEWLPDKEIPQLLKEADPEKGERGIYRVTPEGLDDDEDGAYNEDEPGGVNFNQNFTFQYQFFTAGAGPHQISEAGSRAVADFAFAHRNIAAVFSFGPDNNLLYPWESKRRAEDADRSSRTPVTSVLPEDEKYYQILSRKFRDITKFRDAPAPRHGAGEFSKWAYYHYGRWSLSVPVWWPPAIEAESDTDTTGTNGNQDENQNPNLIPKATGGDPLAAERRLWEWLQQTNQTDKFVEWTEISHPDFPDTTVEVGGFQPYIGINPPVDSLEERSLKNTRFLVHLSHLLGRLSLEKIQVENLHSNVYRITAVVANDGFLPTSSRLGARNQWAPPVKVALELTEEQQLASGRSVHLVEAIAGSGDTREFQWVVIGEQGSQVTLTAGSPMTGSVQRRIELR